MEKVDRNIYRQSHPDSISFNHEISRLYRLMPRYFYNQCRTWRTTVPYSQGPSQIYKLARFVALQELLMHSVKWWQFGCKAPAESVALLIKLAKKNGRWIAGALHWSINPSRFFWTYCQTFEGWATGRLHNFQTTFRIHVLVPSEAL